jgi:histidinol phosphatase-like PHP family hydrolase
VEAALTRGLDFAFGDDSHRVSEVGAGLDEARTYLLEHGVDHVTTLDRADGGLLKRRIPLR